jgi:hypothetical protein
MTGVIVRSSANVQAGAQSLVGRAARGVDLGFVALLPWLLREVPMAALGGVLVVTGWKLVSLKHVKHLFANAWPAAGGHLGGDLRARRLDRSSDRRAGGHGAVAGGTAAA